MFIADLAAEADLGLEAFDIGTGAGFPGLIFAIRYPSRKVTLYEKSLKKQSFLSAALARLSLQNVSLEGPSPEHKRKGLYLARAVFPRADLFKFMRARMAPGSFLVTNLGATLAVPPPPVGFQLKKEIAYSLPMDCGGRKAELLCLVPRETK